MEKLKIATLSAGRNEASDWEPLDNAGFLDDMYAQGKRQEWEFGGLPQRKARLKITFAS